MNHDTFWTFSSAPWSFAIVKISPLVNYKTAFILGVWFASPCPEYKYKFPFLLSNKFDWFVVGWNDIETVYRPVALIRNCVLLKIENAVP